MNKKFIDIVKEYNLFLPKDIMVKVQLCPDCESEVSSYNNNYLCPECGCLKTSCLVKIITVNKLYNKKFEYMIRNSDDIEYLDELGQAGWEMCGIIQTKCNISISGYNTVIYLKKEIID